MANRCVLCDQEMTNDHGCTHTHVDYEDGRVYRRIAYGEETGDWAGAADERHNCHDCSAPKGSYHHAGCDVERCPRCLHQLISCDCQLAGETRDEDGQLNLLH